MNALSYISQNLIFPLSKKKKPKNADISINDEINSITSPFHDNKNTLKDSNTELSGSTTINENNNNNDINNNNNIHKNKNKNDYETIVSPTANKKEVKRTFDFRERRKAIGPKFWKLFITILLFFPSYLLLKPILLLWFCITLPFTFLVNGLSIKHKKGTISSNDITSSNKNNDILKSDPLLSKLDSIHENTEEDLTTGDEFILQRDTVKGSMLRASSIKQFTSSKLKTAFSNSSIDATSHNPTTVFGSKKMGRFLFPKKLIPKSTLMATRRKTLVIDLDETLIHSISRGTTHNNSSQAHIVEVKFSISGISTIYYVYKRPHCDAFLTKISKWYDIVIFTASMKEYADPVIDWLESSFPGSFSKRLYRSDCTLRDGVGYIKDLRVVDKDNNTTSPRDRLDELIIIDNSPVSYAMNVDNAIQVEGWISDPTDTNLLALIPFLEAIRYTTDVRNILSLKNGEKAFHID